MWTLRIPALLALLVIALAPRAQAAVFSCTATGIQDALVAGGGPHTFSCGGPTTVTLTSPPIHYSAIPTILDGENQLTLSGGGTTRIFRVPAGRSLELRNLVVRESGAYEVCLQVEGGATLVSIDSTVRDCGQEGILSDGMLALTRSTVTHCHVTGSGGAAIGNGGGLTITDSTISENNARGITSGSVFSTSSLDVSGSRIAGNRGGITVSGGTFSLADSIVSGNTAEAGGGLRLVGTYGEITGSTISGNTATDISIEGGGIHTHSVLTIRNSTITGNEGGGITNNGTLVLENTTIAGNTGPSATALRRTTQPGVDETLRNNILEGTCTPGVRTSQGGNVESPGDTCGLTHATDRLSVSAAALHLGALGDHGGPTETIPLLEPSAAIDAGVPCPPPTTDQRGVARPQQAGCDAGAYEAAFAVPALPPLGVATLLSALAGAAVLARRSRRRA